MTEIVGNAVSRGITATYSAFTNLDWIRLIVGSMACGLVCVWIGGLLGVPSEPKFSGSLLASGSPVSGMIVAGIAVALSTLAGAVIAGTIESEAGMFCACVGLTALAIRSGPIRPVLQYATGSSVFFLLAMEAVLLAVMIVGVWCGLKKFFVGTPIFISSAPPAPNENKDALLGNKLSALGIQIVAMSILEMIFIQTDVHAQALCGVGLAAFLSVLIAYNVMPLADGIWYWLGPLAAGAIGYLLAYFNGGGITTGDIHGWSAAIARATPLDYASVGTAAAIFGFWCARRWAQPDEEEMQEPVVG